MKFIDLIKYIYTLYIWTFGILLFSCFALLSVVILLFITPQKFSKVFKFFARGLITLFFIRVKVSGTEHIPKNEACILMGNHVSFLDVLLLAAYTPYHTIGIEDKTHFKWPVFGKLITRHGNIPIDRKSAIASKKTYEIALQKLDGGAQLIIFPEGGRTNDGSLRPFRALPFMFAKNAAYDIIPFGLAGVYEMNNKNSILIHPAKIEIRFGSAIRTGAINNLSEHELQQQTRQAITRLLN